MPSLVLPCVSVFFPSDSGLMLATRCKSPYMQVNAIGNVSSLIYLLPPTQHSTDPLRGELNESCLSEDTSYHCLYSPSATCFLGTNPSE